MPARPLIDDLLQISADWAAHGAATGICAQPGAAERVWYLPMRPLQRLVGLVTAGAGRPRAASAQNSVLTRRYQSAKLDALWAGTLGTAGPRRNGFAPARPGAAHARADGGRDA